MDMYSFIFALLLYMISSHLFCHSLLRKNCQVLERKYFAQFVDLRFDICQEFEEFNVSIAVHCDSGESLTVTLKEVPLETDWLCLTDYHGATTGTGMYSRFTSLNALYIKTRNAEFPPGVFSGLIQLTTLWIMANSNLNNLTFHEDTFQGLNSLKELKISYVNFTTFSFAVFNHLHLLDHLILEENNIHYLSEVTASLGMLTSLKKLSVINNRISKLRAVDCLTSQNPTNYGQVIDFNISHLDLSSNKLSVTQQNSLCNFPHLELFTAEASGIDAQQIYKSGIKTVKIFSLPSNSLYRFNICAPSSHFKAEELLLMFSSIQKINTLKGSCKYLKKLNLRGNDLEKIEVKQMQTLDELLELDLSNNNIESLKICANYSVPALKLIYLNVSFNYLLRLTNRQFACLMELTSLSLENNRINHIEDFAFDGLDKLQFLNLQYNNLFRIGEYTLSSLFLLKHLNLYGNAIITFNSQAFKNLLLLQDIRLTYSYMLDQYWWTYIQRSVRTISLNGDIIDLMDIPNEFPFIETLKIDSPILFLKDDAFFEAEELHLINTMQISNFDSDWCPIINFTKLEKLYFSGKPQEISNYSAVLESLKYIPSLKFLYLHDTNNVIKYNNINVNGLFHNLSHLRFLHLKNSGIEHLNSKVIFSDLHELEFLLIEYQNMQEVESVVFDSMPNLQYIYFLQTTFPCSCIFKGFVSWLESDTRVSVIDFHHQECLINHVRINLIFFLDNNCRSDLDFIMFLLSFLCTLLFMCICLCYESIWWFILYTVYTIKCWLNHKLQHKDNYEYDVFVSYNANNEQWVTEQFLPNMEQTGPPFFKVCIHNRDFEIGKDIVDNIMDSIYNSRWTVCIITHSYLQSSWCSLEMRMATYRLLTDSKDSFILIFLDKISKEELYYYYRLTKLLNKKTYLDWPDDKKGQQLFWARLRKVIAKSGRKHQ